MYVMQKGTGAERSAQISSEAIAVTYLDAPKPMLHDVSDTVLYDIFYEAGTQAGGYMVALENLARRQGDNKSAHFWASQRRGMMDERDSVSASDRNARIAFKVKWDRMGTGNEPRP